MFRYTLEEPIMFVFCCIRTMTQVLHPTGHKIGHFGEILPSQIDIIGAVVIVWRVRGKTIRSVLCNIVCSNCAQRNAHTYKQTNSSLDWVLSHWAHFTVLRFIFACIMCIIVYCVHV